jgi:hypothetical protein
MTVCPYFHYSNWYDQCGFHYPGGRDVPGSTEKTVRELPVPTDIPEGTVVQPFCGFYTKDENQYPECAPGGSQYGDWVTVQIADFGDPTYGNPYPNDKHEVLATFSWYVNSTGTYHPGWYMSTFRMPNRDMYVKFEIVINGVVVATTGGFSLRVGGTAAPCIDGDTKCENDRLFVCNNGSWVDTGQPCESPVCQHGETKCVADQLHICNNGLWYNSGIPCDSEPPGSIIDWIKEHPGYIVLGASVVAGALVIFANLKKKK